MTRQHVRPLGWAVVGVCVGLVVVLLLSLLVKTNEVTSAIRHQQVQNSPVLSSTHRAATASQRTLRLIESCVRPAGACNQRNQRATAAAVGNINRSVIAAAACASTLAPQAAGETQQQLVDQITACVVAQLAHRSAGGTQ